MHRDGTPDEFDRDREEWEDRQQRASETLDKIIAVMRDRALADDEALSEIQDFLTIAGYDVPLRSYIDHHKPDA